MRILTYTTDLNNDPEAMTWDEFVENGLPEDWADYIWQEVESVEQAKEEHDTKLDLRTEEINEGKPERAYY